jgi:hypothetical protein
LDIPSLRQTRNAHDTCPQDVLPPYFPGSLLEILLAHEI